MVRYTLNVDQVLNCVRYPRFIYLAKTLFGDEGELITEELLSRGQDIASKLIFRSANRLRLLKNDDLMSSATGTNKDINEMVKKFHNTFEEMVQCHFIRRVPSPYLPSVNDNGEESQSQAIPNLRMPNNIIYKCPESNIRPIAGRY